MGRKCEEQGHGSNCRGEPADSSILLPRQGATHQRLLGCIPATPGTAERCRENPRPGERAGQLPRGHCLRALQPAISRQAPGKGTVCFAGVELEQTRLNGLSCLKYLVHSPNAKTRCRPQAPNLHNCRNRLELS